MGVPSQRDSVVSLSSSLPMLPMPMPTSTSRPASRPGSARRFGDGCGIMERPLSQPMPVKRWDGAARTSRDWDCLRRDPELWDRTGNCFIHLHSRGQSRRGPSFSVPLAALLAARCHPLVERFAAADLPPATTPAARAARYASFDRWAARHPDRRVDLFVPAPAAADKQQAFHYHVATRNLVAWVLRRSLVGAHLGGALVGLLHSMHEFRLPGEDHLDDLLGYCDEEGYLDLGGQPAHALAMLHFAEAFQLRERYIDAYAHCVGMCASLAECSEYKHISTVSRKLIGRAREDLDQRLVEAGTKLRTFLEDELSEAHLGLSSAARAHLERFRSFVLTFYSARLGYYPPTNADDSTAFDYSIYSRMHDDFEALYELLVDESFSSGESIPVLAQGGLCAVQSIHAFDWRYRYPSLTHTLPLLPEVSTARNTGRRLSWLANARDKLKPDQRLVAHAALVKATNKTKIDLLGNDLIRAYHRFEEESIAAPGRGERAEKISLVDARKVRWIFIYAVYQVLNSIILAPPEVRDAEGADYSLAVATEDLPPWKDGGLGLSSLMRRQTDLAATAAVPSQAAQSSSSASEEDDVVAPSTSQFLADLKPDIDYFALTHRDGSDGARASSTTTSTAAAPSRTRSLGRTLSRNSAFRRSLSLFRRESRTPDPSAAKANRKSMYHEIVVHGYGNGTNAVSIDAVPPLPADEVSVDAPALTSRTLSTSSNSTKASAESQTSAVSVASTAPSTAPPTSPTSPTRPLGFPPAHHSSASRDPRRNTILVAPTTRLSSPPIIPPRGRRREVVSFAAAPSPPSHLRRPSTSSAAIPSSDDMADYSRALTGVFPSSLGPPPRFLHFQGQQQQQPPPRRRSWKALNYAASYEDLIVRQREDFARAELSPPPLRIEKSVVEVLAVSQEDEDEDADSWDEMAGVERSLIDREVQDEWEQYTGLGGLRPVGLVS